MCKQRNASSLACDTWMKSVINQYSDSPSPGVVVALFLKTLYPNDVFILKKLNTVQRMTKPPSSTHLESIMIENTALTCRHSL